MNDSPPLIYGWTLIAVVLGPVAILALVAFFVERKNAQRMRRGLLTDEEREALIAAIRLLEHSTLGSADRTRIGLLSIYRSLMESNGRARSRPQPTLTAEEREAIERASRNGWACDGVTLRMLLERLG